MRSSFLRRLAIACITGQSVVQAQLGLNHGFLPFSVNDFSGQLVKDSQTLYSLNTSSRFDFIPTDQMAAREPNGHYHLGDIRFRARQVGAPSWINVDSATTRKPVTALSASGSVLASSNMAPTLQSNSPLTVTRSWVNNGGNLQLLFNVSNPGTTAVEIGAIGAPLEFNNIFTNRPAAQTNEQCSFFDPYIGQDAGFVQVTPLLGTLPPLTVTPVGASPLEGWNFLTENTGPSPFYQSQTFEGLYEWQFHTLAYAQNEWKNVTPWNAASSATLQPGQTRTYGIEFRLASSIRTIEDTVRSAGRPVAVGLPGYIVPMDQSPKLFLSYSSTVKNITVSPAGALTWATNSDSKNASWVGYTLTPHTFGRARLTVTYADGIVQTVHYWITANSVQSVSSLGTFLTTNQWFNDSSDPFRRSPSVISYDREVNAVVRNDPRAWIPGLSDEAGAGSWLAAAMKQYVSPVPAEVTKMEQFVNQTLFGSVQNANGTVKKSVFFYEPALVPNYNYPSSINWGNWWSWNRAAAFATDRAYDYVHVAAAYWALYRTARNYPSLTTRPWSWYLGQAVLTIRTMTGGGVGFTNDGLMGETVYLYILQDLQREGNSNATVVESAMRSRWQAWSKTRYPFGSEMAWDSTGEEGVFMWSKYFNDSTTSTNALNAILAYQPGTIAHWGYQGNARRYWDNIYGGKLQRIERQIHHYGSGLNALPLITQFEQTPTDYHLLRAGYAGLMGSMSNIDSGGFASAAFHAFPDTLKWDAYSGDYGPNFSGHAMGMGTVIINHPQFGWQAFGGTATVSGSTVTVQVLDSVRRRVFIAPIGTLLTLDAGAFQTVTYDSNARSVSISLAAKTPGISNAATAPNGRLVIKQTASVSGVGTVRPSSNLNTDAGAFVIPFTSGAATVTLTTS